MTRAPTCILSPRQREIMRLVANGDCDKEIAARLEISIRTVHAHIINVRIKLKAKNRTHAACLAIGNNANSDKS